MEGCGDIEDSLVGFTRQEMHSVGTAGTAKAPGIHIFVVFGDRESWPAKLEETEGVIARFSEVLQSSKKLLPAKVKVTACEATAQDQEGDILVFPQRRRYRGVAQDSASLHEFCQQALVQNASELGEVLPGAHVFACSHAARDARCGKCGPALIEAIANAAAGKAVTVRACSHVGGHAFAGNLIVFPEEASYGDWFGYVCPNDAKAMIQYARSSDPKPLVHLWRGRSGLSPDEHVVLAAATEVSSSPGEGPSDLLWITLPVAGVILSAVLTAIAWAVVRLKRQR